MDSSGAGDYTTLTAALTAARTGDTILVKNGTYAEHVTVNKGVTVQAYTGHSPVIDGSDSTTPTINITSTCLIDGLRIVGSHDLGESTHASECNIVVQSGATAEIQNCTLTKWNHAGIKVATGGKLIASGNTITSGGWTFLDHGIYMAAGLVGSSITNNNISGAPGWGIHAYNYEYGITISGNNVHDNQGGILVTGENHTITNNTVTNNLGGHGIDFFHYGLIGLTVTGNTLSGNTAYDMYLDAGAGEGFTGCTISGNTGTKNF